MDILKDGFLIKQMNANRFKFIGWIKISRFSFSSLDFIFSSDYTIVNI